MSIVGKLENGIALVKYVFEDGGMYEGPWDDGNMNGRGRFTFCPLHDSDYFEGDFRGGKRWGQGKLVWKNGASYEGGWENDTRSGFGILVKAWGGALAYREMDLDKCSGECDSLGVSHSRLARCQTTVDVGVLLLNTNCLFSLRQAILRIGPTIV